MTALTELDVSSNKEAGGVVHTLVSALPLTQMRRLPLNSCRLSEESFTALGTHVLILLELVPQLPTGVLILLKLVLQLVRVQSFYKAKKPFLSHF